MIVRMSLPVLLVGTFLVASAPARAQVWQSPGYLDWFVGKFHRLLSALKLTPEQRAEVELARKPLAAAVESAIRVERARIATLRDFFAQPEISEEGFRTLAVERKRLTTESNERIRTEALRLLVRLHKLLRPDQRPLLTNDWALRAERRFFRTERPLH